MAVKTIDTTRRRVKPSRQTISMTRHWAWRWHAILAMQARNTQSLVYSLGIYVSVALALAAGALMLHNTLRYVELNAVLSTRQPLFLPIAIMTGVVSIYLALVASLAAARERDRGTLEVLLYGPVDEASFILGHFIAPLQVYAGISLFGFVWANLVTWLLHLDFSLWTAVLLLTTITTVAAIIAFGLLVAVWGGRTRSALVYFILVVLLFASLQIADSVVSGMAISSNPTDNDPVLLLRNVLAFINNIIQWVSPFAQLTRMMDDLINGSLGSYLLHLCVTLVQTGVFLWASIWTLKRKGAKG